MTTLVDDFIPVDEDMGETEGECSSIYAVKLGRQGIGGLENGGIQVERVGELESKDATRTRVKWYVSLALFAPLGIARLQGITSG